MDQEKWEKCVEFHGHECPGLAIGFRATEIAMEKMGKKFSADSDEKIVCITENDACGVDAVQVLSGCTLGKGNLIYKPCGKMAFSFFDRSSDDAIRIVLKPNATKDMDRDQSKMHILTGPEDDLFWIKKPNYTMPESARLFGSVVCEVCGESVPEHKIRMQEGKQVCLDCFNDYDNRW